jgi:hypothetical protein
MTAERDEKRTTGWPRRRTRLCVIHWPVTCADEFRIGATPIETSNSATTPFL